MDEAAWRTCANPERMLESLPARKHGRPLRLLVAVCCERLAQESQDEQALLMAQGTWAWAQDPGDGPRILADLERTGALQRRSAGPYPDSEVFASGVRMLTQCFDHRNWKAEAVWAAQMFTGAFGYAAGGALDNTNWEERCEADRITSGQASAWLCAVIRDLFPRWVLTAEPRWRTATVVHLAQAIYQHRLLPSGQLDPARLQVLADALEDVGVGDEMVRHLRSPQVHVRGCCVIEALAARGSP